VVVAELDGQTSIVLTIRNLPGAVQDVSSSSTYTFSNLQVSPAGDGTVSLTNDHTGAFTYTPPSAAFTGSPVISYQVTDGTGTSESTVEIDVGPIAADQIAWGTLSSTNSTIPSTIVPSLTNRIHSINKGATYTFSDPILAAADGTISDLNPATGSFKYTAPSAAFRGEATVRYTVSDGANSTTGVATIVVAPLVTEPITVTELDHQTSVSLVIQNLPSAVQDVASNPTYTFSNLRISDGAGSLPASAFDDSSVGAFTYRLPSPASPGPVHVEYSVSDGTNTANGVVTIELVAIVANSARYNVLQGASSTLPALAGRIDDVNSAPKLTFSNPSAPAGDGSVQFMDAAQGILRYTPPSSTFKGNVSVQYTVSDGTNSTTGVLNIDVAPLVTIPYVVPEALQTQPTTVPSLVSSNSVQDISSNPSYTFSDPVVPPGDGSAQFTNATTGVLSYDPPFSSFFGVAQVTYTVTDGAANVAKGTIVIDVQQTIRPANDGPITAAMGRPLVIAASELLGNDVAAPDGLKPEIGSVGNPTNGTVVRNADGSVTFTGTALGPASFQYTDTDADNDVSTVATVTLIVKQATTISWAIPADIVYGTALSGAQLDATASVPGTLIYTPAAGTVLRAGYGQTLEVTFTPSDTASYAPDTASVTINVAKATSTIYWNNPGDIVYGTPLSSTQLDANASVQGTFNYIPAPGAVLPVGSGQTLAVSFAPSDAADYLLAFATVSINVDPAPPPGLAVQVRPFSGRVRHKVGGVIAQLHTSFSRLRPTYYDAAIDWGDGVFQAGRLSKAGSHGFNVKATHKYAFGGSYDVRMTISDPLGDSLTTSFLVNIH
jgi:hypothetical protein